MKDTRGMSAKQHSCIETGSQNKGYKCKIKHMVKLRCTPAMLQVIVLRIDTSRGNTLTVVLRYGSRTLKVVADALVLGRVSYYNTSHMCQRE